MSANPNLVTCLLISSLLGACGPAAPPPESPASVESLVDDTPASPRAVQAASPLVKEAEALLAKGDAQGAKSKFEAAISQNPKDARAQLGLGLSSESLGQLDVAERAYREATQIDGSLAEAHNNLGLLLRDKGDLPGAIAALEAAGQADPRLASAQSNLALTLEDAGRSDDAAEAYKKAVRLSADDPMLRANYGLFLLGQGQGDAAVTQLLEGLKLAKGDRATLLALGNGLRRAQKPDVAVRALREAIAAADGKPTPALLAELSLAQLAAKDDAAAKQSLEEAIKLDPKYATGHYLLGSLLAGNGDFKGAQAHYKRTIELDPKGELGKRAKEKLEAAAAASKKR